MTVNLTQRQRRRRSPRPSRPATAPTPSSASRSAPTPSPRPSPPARSRPGRPRSTNPAVLTCRPRSSPTTNNNFSNYAPCNDRLDREHLLQGSTAAGRTATLAGHTNAGRHGHGHLHRDRPATRWPRWSATSSPTPGPRCRAQVEYSLATGMLHARPRTPSASCCPWATYQVDFVCGAAISQFGPVRQQRLLPRRESLLQLRQRRLQHPATRTASPPLANVQGDVGTVGHPGHPGPYTNGSYTLTGSGSDIWGNADAFNYVYQTLNGDGEIVARVVSLSNTDPWAKAGVMIRQSLDPELAPGFGLRHPGQRRGLPGPRDPGGLAATRGRPATATAATRPPRSIVKLVRSGQHAVGLRLVERPELAVQVGSDTVTMTRSRSTSAWP